MTVKELMEELSKLDENLEVFTYEPETGEYYRLNVVEFVDGDQYARQPKEQFVLL